MSDMIELFSQVKLEKKDLTRMKRIAEPKSYATFFREAAARAAAHVAATIGYEKEKGEKIIRKQVGKYYISKQEYAAWHLRLAKTPKKLRPVLEALAKGNRKPYDALCRKKGVTPLPDLEKPDTAFLDTLGNHVERGRRKLLKGFCKQSAINKEVALRVDRIGIVPALFWDIAKRNNPKVRAPKGKKIPAYKKRLVRKRKKDEHVTMDEQANGSRYSLTASAFHHWMDSCKAQRYLDEQTQYSLGIAAREITLYGLAGKLKYS